MIKILNFYDGHKVYMNGLYPAVFLEGKNQHVHRLEWMKYHGSISSDCIIHHINGDKTDWNINNLELLKRSEHILCHQKDLHKPENVKCGDESRHHTLSSEDVKYIKLHYVKYDPVCGGRALAKKFGVTEQCVSLIVREINWKAVK